MTQNDERRRAPKPDWKNQPRNKVDEHEKIRITEYYERELNNRKSDDVIGELAEKYEKSDRQIWRYIKQGKEIRAVKQEGVFGKILDILLKGAPALPEAGSSVKEQKEMPPFLVEAQREHHAKLLDIITEWQRYLFTPLPNEVASKEYLHPLSEIKEEKLFKRLREHIDIPMLWVYDWLWDYHFNYRYKPGCEDIVDRIKQEWFFKVQKNTPAKRIIWAKSSKHHYYMPIYLRLEDWAEERKKGLGLKDKPRLHEYRSERKQASKHSTKREVLALYVDDILVGECYDSEKAIEAYGRFSDEIIRDDDTNHLIFNYLILEDLREKLREQLQNIMERQLYIRNTCRDCPTYEGEEISVPSYPKWAIESLYDNELNKHFDDLVTVGSVIWSRLETLIQFKKKGTSKNMPELFGNIADGASWRDPGFSFMTHIQDIMKIDTTRRLDTLLAECLMHHFGGRADFNAEWTDWGQVTFENIDKETVDKLYSMLARNDIQFCGACPVCHGLKTIFDR